MLEAIAGKMKQAAGIVPGADFGTIHSGLLGYTDCETSLGLERWKGVWFVRFTVRHTRGRGMRKTRVVKWPYAKDDPKALDAVIADLETFADGPSNGCLYDDRTAFGKFFDRLTRMDVLGRYNFRSPIAEPHEIRVKGNIVRYGGQTIQASLTERRPGYGFTLAQMPLAAVERSVEVLRGYASG